MDLPNKPPNSYFARKFEYFSRNFSDEIIFGLYAFIVAYFIVKYIKHSRSNLPPGPIGLPILGHLPFITKDIHLDFAKLGKKYGDIFSVRLGSETVVVLHSGDAVREAFLKSEFLGRPTEGTLKFLFRYSAFFTGDFHLWKEQRPFIVHRMKDLGLGRTSIEHEIQEEIEYVIKTIREYSGSPINPKTFLSPSMSNNISALVFGKRLQYDDPDRKMLDRDLDAGVDSNGQSAPDMFMPWIRLVPFYYKFFKIQSGIEAVRRMEEFFRKEIQKHKARFDPKNIRDFIDSFILEMRKTNEDHLTTFNDDTLIGEVIDLFVAGSETVRTTILWCLYITASKQEVKDKVVKEIFQVVGSSRSPEYMDIKNMPYTHSVILETLRFSTIVPIGVVRKTLSNTKIGGYDIPANTLVFPNLWNVHHDPRYWDEPDSYKPERFIGKEESVTKPINYMPFSYGKRICPGESMAYMEVFLYFTSILQQFDIELPEDEIPDYKGVMTGVYKKDKYNMKFIPRN